MNTLIKTKPRMRFHSRLKEHRVSLILMSVILVLAWTVMPLVLALTYFSIERDLASGFAAVLIAFTLIICLSVATRQFLKVSTSDGYELLIESDVLFLFGVDKLRNKRLWNELCLSDVEEADYYPMSESSTMVLRSKGKSDLELPLWAFGRDAEKKIVDYLRSRVTVVDIPSAIVI